MINILCLNEELRRGGGEEYFVQLINNLHNVDINVHGMTGRGPLSTKINKERVEYFEHSYLRKVIQIRRAVKSTYYQSIHVNSFRILLLLVMACLMRIDTPIIYTKHNYNKLESSWAGRLLYSFILKKYVTKIIVLSRMEQQKLVEICKLLPESVDVIHNGVADIPAPRNTEPKKWQVGFLGRISSEKDPFLFIDILTHLIKIRPTIRAVVAGDGPLLDDVREYAQTQGVYQNVDFLGWVTNPFNILSDIELLAVTSHREQLPISVLQSMAVGTPVMSVNVGALNEVIRYGIDGLVLSHRNPGEFAMEIAKVLEDKHLLKTMGRNCRNRVEQAFTEEHMLDKFRELVCLVIDE
ncbi:glycosyltransferase family 4 protein [Alicyclobacillus curvatus]|nr:glycosyltransferase family 4 protein [Alicyclobacillus curvatus]